LLTGVPDNPNDQPGVPVSPIIARCYPNPFNAGTVISFNLPERLSNSNVQISIYDLQGRKVIQLFDAKLSTGNYFVRWNGNDSRGISTASGIYFYEIKASAERIVAKMQLIR
jgi:flagellar hook assembly protein FlgD